MKKLKNLNLGKELSRVEMKKINGGDGFCECYPGQCFCRRLHDQNLGYICGDPRLCTAGSV
ncbi:hypothetical protein [Flavobacterium aestivum]|uniref:hypothetical protein n=1 Tax=Flavobacterium aestivum TaxID=3003257 RepID=UPI0022865A70|nr:hypothetical protein [Flavobacterium aestivum]